MRIPWKVFVFFMVWCEFESLAWFVLNEARIPPWCIPIQSDRSRIPFTSVAAQSHLPRFDARHCPIRNSEHYPVGHCRNFTVSSSNFRARPVFTSVTNSRKNSTELRQCFLRILRERRLSCSTIASGSFTDCLFVPNVGLFRFTDASSFEFPF